jgi:hypothetical protein
MKRFAVLVVIAGLTTLSACGPWNTENPAPRQATTTWQASCRPGEGFALSLVSDRGGAPDPVAAAVAFSRRNQAVFPTPTSGWRRAGADTQGAYVRSGDTQLHAAQGLDGTWQIDSGGRCR